jgi:hypothetical protein
MRAGSVLQPFETELLMASLPGVEGLPGDPVVPARHGDVAGDLLGVVEDRQAVLHEPICL